jgi:hypothetical protein
LLQAEEVILLEIRHAFAMNAVYDGEEQRWKAGQFMNIKADAPSMRRVQREAGFQIG